MIALTQEERAVVGNAEWIYHKNSALQKVMELLGLLQQALQANPVVAAFPYPGDALRQGGKISRGERYKELPYVILDYPRYFSRDDIFAFRTMFWWGHYFSGTLHLSGSSKEQYSRALAGSRLQLAERGFRVYVQQDPWEHDFENGNYRSVAAMQDQEWERLVHEQSFIKLAKPYALEMWEKIIPEAVADYALLLTLLNS